MPMSSTRIMGAVAAACLLSACDQVRLPAPGDQETTTQEASTAEPEPTVDVVQIEPATTDIVDTDVTERDMTEADTVDIAPPPALITDLAAINAALCGLPLRPLDDSLTLAEITGARPADPDLIETATVNGEAASLIDFPGLVKMEPREFLPSGAIASGHCGATRISEHWFVTAAHCLDDDYDEVSLVVDSETLSSPLAKRVSAVSAVCHAAYGGAGSSYMNDIAMVRIDDDDIASIGRVPIASFGDTEATLVPFNYAEARMAGWGLTAFRGVLSDTLLQADLDVTKVGPSVIEVRSKAGAGPCVGDSGGPLFVSEPDRAPILVGVLSVVEQNPATGAFCEGDYGARYTNLQGYVSWIDDIVATCDNGEGLCGY